MALVFDDKKFQYILRILNTNVNGKEKVMYALTKIKGIGRRFANLVCKKAEIDQNKRYVRVAALAMRLPLLVSVGVVSRIHCVCFDALNVVFQRHSHISSLLLLVCPIRRPATASRCLVRCPELRVRVALRLTRVFAAPVSSPRRRLRP